MNHHANPAQSFEKLPVFGFALIDDLSIFCDAHNKKSDDRIFPVQFLPTQANSTDTGWDVRYAGPTVEVSPFSYVKLNLGIRVCAPAGWGLRLHPRSSTFVKQFIHGHIGIIDNEFNNVMHFCGQYIPDERDLKKENLVINFGDRVAQVVPEKIQKMIVQQFTNAELDGMYENKKPTRNGGFGSSGKR